MAGQPEANDPQRPGDGERASEIDPLIGDLRHRLTMEWVGDHLPEVRSSAYGQRSLYWTLGIAFVVGLAAYAGGYALRASTSTEPLRFVGDLFYTFGYALWTGVVVVLLLQVVPEVKRRGYKQMLDAYEADRAEARGDTDR